MNNYQAGSGKQLLSLQEAAAKLNVTIETLLAWNEHNILKPTITQTGEIGYNREQIDHFQTIQRQIQEAQSAHYTQPVQNPFLNNAEKQGQIMYQNAPEG